MNNYCCTECEYLGDEPICPHCNIPTERLDVSDDMYGDANGTYPDEVIEKVKDEDDLKEEELEEPEEEKKGKKPEKIYASDEEL